MLLSQNEWDRPLSWQQTKIDGARTDKKRVLVSLDLIRRQENLVHSGSDLIECLNRREVHAGKGGES